MVSGLLELATLLSIIQAEYRQSPTLNLTKLQMQRLWSLDAATCDAVIDALVSARVLQQTVDGTYVLRGSTS